MDHETARTKTTFTYNAAADAGNGSITALVAPYNVPDGRPGIWRGTKYTDTVYEPGCFDKWIEAHGTRRTKFMFDHGDADMPLAGGTEHGANALPIGTVAVLESRDDGLYFEADFGSSALAQNVRELASNGGLTDVSLGSVTTKAEVRSDGYRHVLECEAWDVSVVVWGQFLEAAPILEVNARELRQDSVITCGAALEAAVYDCVTDMILDWRQDGTITAAEFVSLSAVATQLLEAVQSALPAEIAARETDDDRMPSWWRKRQGLETAAKEMLAGASISAENAAALGGAAVGVRECMAMLETHAGTVERIVSEGVYGGAIGVADNDDENASLDHEREMRLRLMELES